MLGGLLFWAAHFFIVYGAASIFHTSTATRLITAVATLACLSGAAWLAWKGWRGRAGDSDRFGAWTHSVAALSGAGACVAILWQGLPALLI